MNFKVVIVFFALLEMLRIFKKTTTIIGIANQVMEGNYHFVSTYVTSFFLIKNYIILSSSGLY
ncbi:hypothetical protein [Pseudolactococcus laudensis]|uniref:hypothetical protein n=1 Tax=Pseudolactococcus laudensis TaxID=1494461 RepID=UPI00058C1A26